MALTQSVYAAKENVARTIEEERKFLMLNLTTMMHYFTAFASGCRTSVANNYNELKSKGIKEFASNKYKQLGTFVSKPNVKVTVASAAGGAAVVGASGGLTGMTAGAGIGAALGVVPAIFTFGLSIPIGGVIGGTIGLCAGTAVGGSAGLVGGGAAGYYGYEHREEIKSVAKNVNSKATSFVDGLKQRVTASKTYAASLVSSTGGTKEKAL